MLDMTDPEIVLNLWYVHDREGFIYSLRGRLYVGVGSEDEKIELLQHFALIDYLIARPFPIPEAFHIHFLGAESEVKLPVAYRRVHIDMKNTPLRIFEDAIRILNDEIPAQTKLEIPCSPIVCITPLLAEDDGRIRPFIEGTVKLED